MHKLDLLTPNSHGLTARLSIPRFLGKYHSEVNVTLNEMEIQWRMLVPFGTLSDIFGHDCSWVIREKLSI